MLFIRCKIFYLVLLKNQLLDLTKYIYIRNKNQRLASQRGCKINTIDCMYSKLPSDDE